MAFPSSPVNGQTAVVNNITYTYNSSTNSWRKTVSALSNLAVTNTLTVSNLSITGNIITTANIQGNYVLATTNVVASGNIQGNYIVGNGSKLTNLNAASTGKAIAMSIVFGG
jgi:hypothetical protein